MDIDWERPLQMLTATGWEDIQKLGKSSSQLSYSCYNKLYTKNLSEIQIRNTPLQIDTVDVICKVFYDQQMMSRVDDALKETLHILKNRGILKVDTFEVKSGKFNLDEIYEQVK